MRSLRNSMAVALVGVMSVVGMTSCGSGEAAGSSSEIEVVTTVAPLTSIAAAVIGDNATITGIVPEGVNSHTFEPRPSDAEALEGADVIFMNGLQLEQPTLALAEEVAPASVEIVQLGEAAIEEDQWIYDFSFPREGGKPNPHLWTNPRLAGRYAEIIRDEMQAIDPRNAEEYRSNTESFLAQVAELDEAMRVDFVSIPAGNRRLLTYHDAYAYFARDYGWEVIGAIQPSTFDDPTPAEVADLIDQVRDTGVPAIFGSEVFPSSVLEQIGAETGVRYVDVLRDDDLPGSPGDPEHSWLGLMRFDYATMTEALGGQPARLMALAVDPPVADEAVYPQ